MNHVTRVSIEEHAVADIAAGPYALTTGPDGALWFTLVHSGRIGRLVPGDEPTSHRLAPDSGPTVITPGPDGALWFTEYRADRIGRIATDGVVDEFDVPTPGCGPFGIAAGPDGALWFTETATDRITVDGSVTEFPLPVTGAFPSAITAGGDGGMWFTLNQAGAIGGIDMNGAVTLHSLPTEAAGPVGIAAGRDGALWFVEIAAGQIGRITPDGRITEFPLPDRAARPHAVTVDGQGAAWFTEWGGNRVGTITLDGSVTVHDLPTPCCGTASPLVPTAPCGLRSRSARSPASLRRAAPPEQTLPLSPTANSGRSHGGRRGSFMKYALVIFETDESRRRVQADRAAYRKAYEGWIGSLAAAGKLVGGEALETEHTAPATVRTAADGTTTVTDGPAHAGEETLGGWFIVEVAP